MDANNLRKLLDAKINRFNVFNYILPPGVSHPVNHDFCKSNMLFRIHLN